MRTPKNSHDLIRQNEKIVKKPQKHDVNLQKNSTLYFQIGLIVCLLFTLGMFEMKFETQAHVYPDYPPLDDPDYFEVPLIKPETPSLVEPIEKKEPKYPERYEEVPDETPENPSAPAFVEPVLPENPVFNPDALPPLEENPDTNTADIPVTLVQKVPVYPGCERYRDNDKRRQCMSEKITKLIQQKFNTNIAEDYGLTGVQRISVQFKIDKTGEVVGIKARAPHPKLDEEAVRVINKIPKMTPGMQNNKNVGVIYTLPIVFQFQD